MELHFTRTNGPADDAIDALISMVGDVQHAEMVREIILTGLKAGQEIRNRADMKLMNSTLKEMRFTTRIFAPYEEIKKVTVFGSARTEPDEPIYAKARRFGRKLAEAGYMVITGGGPGIMQAVNEGAGNEHSFGVNIRLPFEQKPNPVLEDSPRIINYKYFFNRKVAFLKESDAIALFPGGFGTLDEAMETLTLMQTGKHNPMPLVLLDEAGGTYWERWLGFLKKELLGRGYISPEDLQLFDMTDSVEEAVQKIDRFYRRYHSIRYVGNRVAIRMNSPISQQRVEGLKEAFSDILRSPGELFLSSSLSAEQDETGIEHLPRLVLDFNLKDFSRLRRLIDSLNDA